MSLQQVLYILWRRLWIVVLAFASTLLGAAAVVVFVPARYDAVATASIDPGQADPISGEFDKHLIYRNSSRQSSRPGDKQSSRARSREAARFD